MACIAITQLQLVLPNVIPPTQPLACIRVLAITGCVAVSVRQVQNDVWHLECGQVCVLHMAGHYLSAELEARNRLQIGCMIDDDFSEQSLARFDPVSQRNQRDVG